MKEITQYEWTKTEGDFKDHYLKPSGFAFIQRPDWIAKALDGTWYSFEIKAKAELFQPSPFDGSDKVLPNGGHGLNRYQLESRLAFEASTGVVAVLVVKDTERGWLWGLMSDLYEGSYFLTKKKVVIFPIEAFKPLKLKKKSSIKAG